MFIRKKTLEKLMDQKVAEFKKKTIAEVKEELEYFKRRIYNDMLDRKLSLPEEIKNELLDKAEHTARTQAGEMVSEVVGEYMEHFENKFLVELARHAMGLDKKPLDTSEKD